MARATSTRILLFFLFLLFACKLLLPLTAQYATMKYCESLKQSVNFARGTKKWPVLSFFLSGWSNRTVSSLQLQGKRNSQRYSNDSKCFPCYTLAYAPWPVCAKKRKKMGETALTYDLYAWFKHTQLSIMHTHTHAHTLDIIPHS